MDLVDRVKLQFILKIIEVNDSHADIVGKVHSTAWKDAYKDIFSAEYINQATRVKTETRMHRST